MRKVNKINIRLSVVRTHTDAGVQQQQQQHDATQDNMDGGNHSHHIHQIVSGNRVAH